MASINTWDQKWFQISDTIRPSSSPRATYNRIEFPGEMGSMNLYVGTYISPPTVSNGRGTITPYIFSDGEGMRDQARQNTKLRYVLIIARNSGFTDILKTVTYTETDDEAGWHYDAGGWSEYVWVKAEDGSIQSQSRDIRINWYKTGATTKLQTEIPLSNGVFYYKIQIYYSVRGHNTWYDTATTKTYAAYAPLRPAITKPAKVWGNDLNTFGLTIESQFKSALTGSMKPYNGNTRSLNIVRTEQAPYPTSGQATNSLYFIGESGTNSSDQTLAQGTYTITCDLFIQDPNNAGYQLIVGTAEDSGEYYCKAERNFGMYQATFGAYDSKGYYEQYGVMLRNLDSQAVLTADLVLRYGAKARIMIVDFTSTAPTSRLDTNQSQHFEYAQYLPSTGREVLTRISLYAYGAWGGQTVGDYFYFRPNVIDYHVPTVTDLTVHRCDEFGILDDNGDHAKIEWAVNITSINNQNSKKLVISHPQGSTTFDPLESYLESGFLVVAATTESSYSITATVTDDIKTTARTVMLSTAGVIWDILNGGHGYAFGKVATQEYALEVSSDWKFLCYQLMIGNIDVVKWMQDKLARISGLEQFVSNLGSTSQYQVSFYNGSELWDRQWVRSGEDASAPNDLPTKPQTETTTYSFVGWALTDGATTANPNALKNITSFRSIYAAFSAAIRYYRVAFYNGNTLLQTVSDNQYHGNATYSEATPVDPDGGLFVGWMKSGRYVEKNTDARAQFYYDQEITDSWEDIITACDNGTYKEKYKPGNWKMLDLGSEGNIKMRIKGFEIHQAPGLKKLPITWEADNKLATKKPMNTAPIEKLWEEDSIPGFVFTRTDQHYFYDEYEFFYLATNEARSNDNRATVTFTVKAKRTTTVSLQYYSDKASSYFLCKMNGTTLMDQSVYSSWKTVSGSSVSLTAGQTVVYEVETYTNSYINSLQIGIVDVPEDYSDDDFNPGIIVTFETNMVDKQIGFKPGTGAMNGFGSSELLTYLRTNIKSRLPDELKKGIKRVRLKSASVRSDKEAPNYKFVPNDTVETDIFIPSSDEIIGANEGNTTGVDFNMLKYQYRKKENNSSVYAYWCRDVYPTSGNTEPLRYAVIYGSSNTDGLANKNYSNVTTSLPVYICFCT